MGNSASAALPYSIEKEEFTPKFTAHNTGWAIHNGSQKSNPSQPVSVFKFSKSSNAISSSNPLEAEVRLLGAQHHFQKIKTLVHPHLLRAYATLDTDNPDGTNAMSSSSSIDVSTQKGDWIIVTEHVIPLSAYLNQVLHSNDDRENNKEVVSNMIAWGLVSIIEALHFLHSTAQLSHGRVCIDSIYVTRGGDFKLGDFSLLTNINGSTTSLPRLFTDLQAVLTPTNYISPERLEQRWELVSSCPPHIMDSYSMGILIQELYSSYSLDGNVPRQLVKAIQRLTTSNVKLRPRIGPLLKCPVFKENDFVNNSLVLDNLTTKPAEEKIAFIQKLPDLMTRNIIHKRAVEYKVLPHLVSSVKTIVGGQAAGGVLQQDVSRREILAIIAPLCQITQEVLTPDNIVNDTFTNIITPTVISLFTINDRGIRGSLLTRFIPLLASNLPPKIMNSSIFEPMCSGFTDSSAALRELTLKSSLPLVHGLSASNMDKLCRYLIRLQNDEEASVRTNTIIFVGKIAPHISPTNRSNLILPAFTRAMTDDFTPCRLAALRSVLVCKEYFDNTGIAKKVLPLVVPHLVDPVSAVRTEAYTIVDAFMIILRKESDKLREMEEIDGNGNNGASNLNDVSTNEESGNGTASAGYFSGFSSWAVGAMSSQTSAKTAQTTNSAPKVTKPPVTPVPVPTPRPTLESTSENQMNKSLSNVSLDNDGWSDEDDDQNEFDGLDNTETSQEPTWVSNPTPTATKLTSLEDEEDVFASAFSQPAAKPIVNVASTGNTKKLLTTKLSKPAATRTTSMTLAERKAEFEKRKLERMEKRMKQWEQTSQSGTVADSRQKSGSNLTGWTDFSR